jgi:hypothetical protein
LGEKFGGNAPLFAAALNDTHAGEIDVTLIGAMGHGELLPIFQAALGAKTKRLLTLVAPACSTCLEFTDGKVMLSDMAACAEIIWERLIDCVGQSVLDSELKTARFISAVNWSKLPYAGVIWSKLADRLAELAALLRSRIAVDRVIIHPNDDAACASAARTVYVPGADETPFGGKLRRLGFYFCAVKDHAAKVSLSVTPCQRPLKIDWLYCQNFPREPTHPLNWVRQPRVTYPLPSIQREIFWGQLWTNRCV